MGNRCCRVKRCGQRKRCGVGARPIGVGVTFLTLWGSTSKSFGRSFEFGRTNNLPLRSTNFWKPTTVSTEFGQPNHRLWKPGESELSTGKLVIHGNSTLCSPLPLFLRHETLRVFLVLLASGLTTITERVVGRVHESRRFTIRPTEKTNKLLRQWGRNNELVAADMVAKLFQKTTTQKKGIAIYHVHNHEFCSEVSW